MTASSNWHYKGVGSYSLDCQRDVAGHGDWLEEEVRAKGHNSLFHNVKLTSGSFHIEAEDIEYKWTPLPNFPAKR